MFDFHVQFLEFFSPKKSFILDNINHDQDQINYGFFKTFFCLSIFSSNFALLQSFVSPKTIILIKLLLRLFTCFIVSRSIKFKHNQTQLEICLKCLSTVSYDFLVYLTLGENAAALFRASC